jgi:DNA-binding MurR/RpiR family transcriptional regulator
MLIPISRSSGVDHRLCAGRGRIYVIGEKNSYPIACYIQAHLNFCLPDVVLLDTGAAGGGWRAGTAARAGCR